MAQVGDKIKILYMRGEPHFKNKTGIIEFIDCAGQIHGTWGHPAIIPEIDSFEIVYE